MSRLDISDMLLGSPLDGPSGLVDRVYQVIKQARSDSYEQGHRQGYDEGYQEAEADAAVVK